MPKKLQYAIEKLGWHELETRNVLKGYMLTSQGRKILKEELKSLQEAIRILEEADD